MSLSPDQQNEQSAIAGLLSGLSSSIGQIAERQRQQKLAQQRRSEVEEFQISERENARQVREDEKEEARQLAQEKYDKGLELAKTYSKDVSDITPSDLMLRENELGEYSPYLVAAYHQLYQNVQPKMITDKKQKAEGGNIATWTERYDNNPYSKTYLQRETDPDTDEVVKTNYQTTPSLEDNPDFTGQAGSQKKRIKSEALSLIKRNGDAVLGTKSTYYQINEALIAQKSLADIERKQNDGVLTKETQTKLDNLEKQLQFNQDAHAKALDEMRSNIDDIMSNNADLKGAATLSDALKKQERNPEAYESAIRQAYTRKGYTVGKNTYKIDNEDFLILRAKYESLFAKPFPSSGSDNTQNQGSGSSPTKQTPKVTVARKQYSASANKTKLIYSDGHEEIVDGRQ